MITRASGHRAGTVTGFAPIDIPTQPAPGRAAYGFMLTLDMASKDVAPATPAKTE
jgi:hypothetical protein